MNDRLPLYDRELLLFGPKRNAVLELSEGQRYGSDSYGDAHYVSIYGMRPPEWYAKGVRVPGRTAVECTRDGLASAIGVDIAKVAIGCPSAGRALIADPSPAPAIRLLAAYERRSTPIENPKAYLRSSAFIGGQ